MDRPRPHRLVVVYVVAATSGLAACDLGEYEDCPSGALEVRPFDGPPVTENRLECSGLPCFQYPGDELYTSWTEGCGRRALHFGVSSVFTGRHFEIYLDPASDAATAWFVISGDVGDPTRYEVQDGWIAIDRWDGDVLVGRFDIEVAPEHTARGEFDTRIDDFFD